jgi:hypothetical protein
MIRQWIEELTEAEGGPVSVQAYRFGSRLRAKAAAEKWLDGR